MKMSKRKHLQEIYGEDDTEVEVTEEEVGLALHDMIKELKEKYGDEWMKHISEVSGEK